MTVCVIKTTTGVVVYPEGAEKLAAAVLDALEAEGVTVVAPV